MGGYSSYMAHTLDPRSVSTQFDAQFHFSTAGHDDQVALMFFLGQEGVHEFGSDYVAVSYVKGHVLLTWDLGSGPRRIFTRSPVDRRYAVHAVRFGRQGRLGWLQVDQMANITGRSPGARENLNVSASVGFSTLHLKYVFTLMRVLCHTGPLRRRA